jgi:hypothetical protein
MSEDKPTKEQIENALATIKAVYDKKDFEGLTYFRDMKAYEIIVIMLTEALENLD